MLSGLRKGGTFLLNTIYKADEIVEKMPNKVKRILAEKEAKFYIIDAITLAREIGLGNRTNTILQSAFFKLNEHIMPFADAEKLMKEYAAKTYGRRGESVVKMNWRAIEVGYEGLTEVKVDPAWKDLQDEEKKVSTDKPEFVKKIAEPINRIEGYDLPVSTFTKYVDGTMESGSTQYEKRAIANFVPRWIEENCIQCNQCAFVCPHAVIRPFLLTEEEKANAPEGLVTIKPLGKGFDGLEYRIQVSPLDCTGCEVCVNVCPGRRGAKALEMVPIGEEIERKEAIYADYLFNNVTYKDNLMTKIMLKVHNLRNHYLNSTVHVLDAVKHHILN